MWNSSSDMAHPALVNQETVSSEIMIENACLAVCVGAGKAGTTTLHALMERHPAVCVTRYKETNFFYRDDLSKKGYAWYLRKCYGETAGCRLLFEADPRYMLHPKCIDRIAEGFPDARIIVMLRNPVDRAYSQYIYRVGYGRHNETFEDMCAAEPRLVIRGEDALAEFGFLARSKYAGQIEHILRRFRREQIYFIVFERFVQDQAAEFRSLQDWLGIPVVDIGPVWENESGEPRSMFLAKLLYHPTHSGLRSVFRTLLPFRPLRNAITARLANLNLRRFQPTAKPLLDRAFRDRLMEEFADEIVRTEHLTGLDLSIWR